MYLTSDIYACGASGRDGARLLLLDIRVHPSAQHNRAIIHACANGRDDIIQLLMADSRVDPGTRRNQAILRACKGGFSDVVETLLADSRVDPAAPANRVCEVATKRGRAKIMICCSSNPQWSPSEAVSNAFWQLFECDLYHCNCVASLCETQCSVWDTPAVGVCGNGIVFPR
jgi:hypothetical protein